VFLKSVNEEHEDSRYCLFLQVSVVRNLRALQRNWLVVLQTGLTFEAALCLERHRDVPRRPPVFSPAAKYAVGG